MAHNIENEVTRRAVTAALAVIDEATGMATKKSKGPCGDKLASQLDQVINAALKEYGLRVKWKPSTPEMFWDRLGALPPASRTGDDYFDAFLLGEASSIRNGQETFHAFKRCLQNDICMESEEPVTFAEFKAEFPRAELHYH